MKDFEYIGVGFVSNDHLAVLPYIPLDTKVKILTHRILGGGPAGNSTAGAAALGLRAAFVGTVGDDADGRQILETFAHQGVDTSMTAVRPGATSAIAYLWIDEKTGNRSCAWTREGLDELTADEIDPEAVAAATPGEPLLVAERLELDAGKKIRITGVDQLTADTFGRMRTLVSVATPMAAMPAVELVDSNGQVVTSGDWHFSLSADGKSLRFGRATGLCILLR